MAEHLGSDSGLTVEGLSVAYARQNGRDTPVVLDVSFSLESGSILGLAGESGCGKSTTALAAIGYRPPGSRVLAGSSEYGGVDLLRLPSEKLRSVWGRRVAYVAQNASTALNPAMTIGRQLAQPLRTHLGLRGAALRERQLELLEAVAIPDPPAALSRFPHQFSGGQQQRITLAITFSCKPDVLVLDEPTTGLDVTTQARMSALLRTLILETAAATLYVSHDLAVLGSLTDRLAIMYAGQIIEYGATDDVLERPQHPYTQALLAAVPSSHAYRAVAGIPGRPPAQASLDGCAFASRCMHAVKRCREGAIPLIHVAEGRSVRCVRVEEIVAQPVILRKATRPSPPFGPLLLEVKDLWCAYEQTRAVAVRGVSFSLAGSELLGIVGESGSGKSTLLRAIVGLHPWQRGTIRLRGVELARSVTKRPRSMSRELQIIFQNPDSSLNPRHTVAEIIRRPIELFRDDVPRSREFEVVGELLEAVKLPSAMLNRYPSQLSGGQKQRVAIARAFGARPALLLCDEITSSLDVSVQATIIELIAELSAKFGAAVIFVSHDLAVVRTIATRALVMLNGEICEEGATDVLFTRPTHAYTLELIKAIPKLAMLSAREGVGLSVAPRGRDA